MMRRLVVVVALVLTMVVATAVVPRRAAATDNLAIIIPSAVSGVVAVALVIAILMADRKGEPELDLAGGALPPRLPSPGLHFALECRPTASGRPLLCW